jgi:hypothetical protein
MGQRIVCNAEEEEYTEFDFPPFSFRYEDDDTPLDAPIESDLLQA